jgi:hypothetical protein
MLLVWRLSWEWDNMGGKGKGNADMPGVGPGNNPNSHRLTAEARRKGREKIKARMRQKVTGVIEELQDGGVPSKYRLWAAQEEIAKVARDAGKTADYWRRQKEAARRALFTQRGIVVKAEMDADKQNWSQEERQRTIGPLKTRMLDLKHRFDEVKAEYKDAEAWLLDVLDRMRKFAEAAAPYFDPKLAATEQKVTTTNTTVSINVTADATAALAPYRDVLRSLVGGGLGPPTGALLPDSAEEPVDSGEAAPEAGDVPHDGVP